VIGCVWEGDGGSNDSQQLVVLACLLRIQYVHDY
jgi:hypothetical protein